MSQNCQYEELDMSKIWSFMIYVSRYTETILLFYYFVLEMSNINKNDGTLSDNMIELIISTKEPNVSKKWSISTYIDYVKKENIMK